MATALMALKCGHAGQLHRIIKWALKMQIPGFYSQRLQAISSGRWGRTLDLNNFLRGLGHWIGLAPSTEEVVLSLDYVLQSTAEFKTCGGSVPGSANYMKSVRAPQVVPMWATFENHSKVLEYRWREGPHGPCLPLYLQCLTEPGTQQRFI